MTMNEKARKWRQKQGYTLAEGAKALGISIGYLSDIETGKRGFSLNIIRTYMEADPKVFKFHDFY